MNLGAGNAKVWVELARDEVNDDDNKELVMSVGKMSMSRDRLSEGCELT